MTDQATKLEQIVTRTWEDESFKQELLSNPNAVMERELEEKIPEGVEVRVVQEDSNTRYLVVPSTSGMALKERQAAAQQIQQQAVFGNFSSVIARAIEDDDFKQELLSQPNTVIEQHLGIKLPEGVQIRVLEESSNIRYLVLPERPDSFGDSELSEEELEAVAGGSWCGRTFGNITVY